MMANSSASSSEGSGSASFGLLHPKIQRWVWDAGRGELKDAQERAIPVILEGKKDIVIAAATAPGKTEAAFLPVPSSAWFAATARWARPQFRGRWSPEAMSSLQGDWIQDTVALMLSTRGLDALNLGLSIWVRGLPVGDWRGLCQEIVANPPSEAELMQHVVNQRQEKWDFLLPDDLLVRNYVSHNLDIKGATDVLEAFA